MADGQSTVLYLRSITIEVKRLIYSVFFLLFSTQKWFILHSNGKEKKAIRK